MPRRQRPFTDDEVVRIRELLIELERWRWLRGIARSVAAWITVVAGGYAVTKLWLVDLLKSLTNGK